MVNKDCSKSRIVDEDGFRIRAGCLCFRDEKEEEVLLVSTRHGGTGRWVVPAGGVEPGEEIVSAAVREVKEEASTTGTIGRYLGVFQNDSSNSRTHVYVMFVKEVGQTNDENRKNRWFSIKEAIEVLGHRPVQQSYFERLGHSKNDGQGETNSLPQKDPS